MVGVSGGDRSCTSPPSLLRPTFRSSASRKQGSRASFILLGITLRLDKCNIAMRTHRWINSPSNADLTNKHPPGPPTESAFFALTLRIGEWTAKMWKSWISVSELGSRERIPGTLSRRRKRWQTRGTFRRILIHFRNHSVDIFGSIYAKHEN